MKRLLTISLLAFGAGIFAQEKASVEKSLTGIRWGFSERSCTTRCDFQTDFHYVAKLLSILQSGVVKCTTKQVLL